MLLEGSVTVPVSVFIARWLRRAPSIYTERLSKPHVLTIHIPRPFIERPIRRLVHIEPHQFMVTFDRLS